MSCELSVAELERIAALGWRGLESERIGGWLLRAAGGFTGRANSVLPLGDPQRSLEDAVSQVQDWYAARGLAARFQLPQPLAAVLDRDLANRGWGLISQTLVMTAELAAVLDRLSPSDDAPPVRLAERPDEHWLAAYHHPSGPLPVVAVPVMVAADRPVFASIGGHDGVLAIGRAVVDEGWMGLTALEVAPVARRRGLARHLLRHLVLWACDRGAGCVWLQVTRDNDAAITLYRRIGFTLHHGYHYRVAPS